MNCQRARDIFPELLDARTPATAHLDARAHLANCPDCQREFAALSQTLTALDSLAVPAPTSRLRKNFYAMLEEEKNSAASVRAAAARDLRARRVSLWRWVLSPLAGCALVALGFVAGTRYQTPVATTVAPPTNTLADATALKKIDELEKKLNTMGQLVGYTFMQQQQRPANERLRGVLTSATVATEDPNEKVINELISALALDPSVNVRLRALDGLSPHADQEVVRAGVLASLPREQNALVQVSMIDFLAASRDVDAKPVLEKIAVSTTADTSVRDAAQRALTHF